MHPAVVGQGDIVLQRNALGHWRDSHLRILADGVERQKLALKNQPKLGKRTYRSFTLLFDLRLTSVRGKVRLFWGRREYRMAMAVDAKYLRLVAGRASGAAND